MIQINDGQRFVTDPLEATRIAFLVEESDVGTSFGSYLGQQDYTFSKDDVGRLGEIVMEMSPGFVSWRFGSIFCDLRKKYPDKTPYRIVE